MVDRSLAELTAIHEAGHATVARRLGVCCGGATLMVEAGSVLSSRGYGAYAVVHDRNSDAETRIIIALAGPVAENRYAGRPGVTLPDGADHLDWTRVARLVSRYGLSAAGLDQLRRRTRRLVKQHWAAITKVADALLKHQVLTASDIDDLVADQIPNGFGLSNPHALWAGGNAEARP